MAPNHKQNYGMVIIVLLNRALWEYFPIFQFNNKRK
jgi:hypothetical protein